MRRAAGFAVVAVIAVTAGVVECGTPGSPPVIAPSAGVPAMSASPSATIAPDIAHAIRQREQFGLRADLEWVLAVASEPRARIRLLDFPMLPEEEAALSADMADLRSISGAVKGYANTHPDVFGGVYIDPARHTVVALWTADPETHRLAILQRLKRIGPLEVRLVRYAEQDLRALQDRISGDWDWMAAIRAQPMSVGNDITGNVVLLRVSSANPAAPALILAHYGVPADMLRIESDGTGILLLPRGTIRGTVVTADGKVPGSNVLNVTWTPDGDGPGRGDCGILDMGFGVSDQGRFELPCAPGGWTITLEVLGAGEGDWTPVGSGHVVVPPGGVATLRIVLDPGAAFKP